MNRSDRQHRLQWILGAIVMALVLYYLFVFRPLAVSVASLNEPIAEAREELAGRMREPIDDSGDWMLLQSRLAEVRKQRQKWTALETSLRRQVRLSREIEANMDKPFQLIEFEIERQYRIEELLEQAVSRKVRVEADLTYRFPEYSNETVDPPLLWGQLAILYHALGLAMNAGVVSIDSVKVLPVRRLAASEIHDVRVDELRFEMTMQGDMGPVARFLAGLPLREGELQSDGSITALPRKPALFVDGILLRKDSRENPDTVRLDLKLSGFVFRDLSISDEVEGDELAVEEP